MIPGNKLYAFNAETGDIVWTFPGAGGGKGQENAIADGMLFFTDTYTGQLFAFGKGPTNLNVSVSKSQIAKGEYIWVTGELTDQSPAQQGTPVVSKESMDNYMAWLHAGFPEPEATNITGVPLTLKAHGSSGDIIELGQITTDAQGYFSFKWVPPEEDLYTVTAAFEGDESYWESSGFANVAVAPALAEFPKYGTSGFPSYPDSFAFTTADLVLTGVSVAVVCLTAYTLWVVRKLKK